MEILAKSIAVSISERIVFAVAKRKISWVNTSENNKETRVSTHTA